MRTWSFSSSGALFFGREAVRHHLRDACERLGVKRAFVVTDEILVMAGLLAQTAEPLTAAGVTFEAFDKVTPEPGVALFVTALRRHGSLARRHHRSRRRRNMDTAKLVSMISMAATRLITPAIAACPAR